MASTEFLEKFVLAAPEDRERALAELPVGSAEHFWFRYLALEGQGESTLKQRAALIADAKASRTNYQFVERMETRLMLHSIPTATAEKRAEYQKRIADQLGMSLLDTPYSDHGALRGAAPDAPPALHRLPPEALSVEALKGAENPTYLTEEGAIALLLDGTSRDPKQVMVLLGHIRRPDVPGLVRILHDQLTNVRDHSFGQLEVHRLLTWEQLQELCERRPALRSDENMVSELLLRVESGVPDVMQDDAALAELLQLLHVLVADLPPKFRNLQRQVLVHQLKLDQRLGRVTAARLLQLLPLQVDTCYVAADFVRSRYSADPAWRASASQLLHSELPRIAREEEEALVKDLLLQLLIQGEPEAQFEPYLDSTWLASQMAEAALLRGAPASETLSWLTRAHDPALAKRVTERPELLLVPENKRHFRWDEPVVLDVDVKNVPALIVKVFEVNTEAYYRKMWKPINTDLNLDGLVSSEERVHHYREDPALRVRRSFQFPSLSRRGVFIIDFIGNGISSRAFIEKGQLRFVERQSVAGHVFVLMDEDYSLLPRHRAALLMGSRRFAPDEHGEVLVPFASSPPDAGTKKVAVVLESEEEGGAGWSFASLGTFEHAVESYSLSATFYVDRESLVKSAVRASVLVTAALQLNDTPAPLAMLRDVRLHIHCTDMEGASTDMDTAIHRLSEDKDLVHSFLVPPNLRNITFALSGTVQPTAAAKPRTLRHEQTFSLNKQLSTSTTHSAFYRQGTHGYELVLVGRTGEPLPDIRVKLSADHWMYHSIVSLPTVVTDARGVVELGPLEGVSALRAEWEMADLKTTFSVEPMRDIIEYPSVMQLPRVPADEVLVELPFKRAVPEGTQLLWSEASLLRVLERDSSKAVSDEFGRLRLLPSGCLAVMGLPPGSYHLLLKHARAAIELLVAGAPPPARAEEAGSGVTTDPRAGFLFAGATVLQASPLPAAPLHVSSVARVGDDVVISLQGATNSTRVHVLASHFAPAYELRGLATSPSPALRSATTALPQSLYQSGRVLDEEYRYVLDRQQAEPMAGNTLPRPSLLLQRWELREAATTLQHARAGEQYRFFRKHALPKVDMHEQSFDFLARPSDVLLNLRPDRSGRVTLPLSCLSPDVHRTLTVLAADARHRVVANVALGAPPASAGDAWLDPAFRDVRLAAALSDSAAMAERKRIKILAANETFSLRNVTASVVTYDSAARMFSLQRARGRELGLDEFSWLLEWPTLSEAAKRGRLSSHASHELHLFLFMRDRPFFDAAVLPHLRSKLVKTFIDRWLLQEDLTGYLTPHQFGRLNAAERALLVGRLPHDLSAAVLRRLQDDTPQLTGPDFNALFSAAMQAGAMDEDQEQLQPPPTLRAEGAAAMRGAPAAAAGMAHMRVARSAAPAALEEEADEADEEVVATSALFMEMASDVGLGGGDGMHRSMGVGMARALRANEEARQERDLARVGRAAPLHQPTEQVKVLVESNYYRAPTEREPHLVPPNAFWLDYAKYRAATASADGTHPPPFLSQHFGLAVSSRSEALLALAVHALPLQPPEPHAVEAADGATQFTPSCPVVLFLKELAEAEAAVSGKVLIGQAYIDPQDAFTIDEDGERVERYVTDGEMLRGRKYDCQVVVTNVGGGSLRLSVLLQVPEGAVPLDGGKELKSVDVTVGAYETKRVRYSFYFPRVGHFRHYPAIVTDRHYRLMARAPSATLNVVSAFSTVDSRSWPRVVSDGSNDEVLEFLRSQSLHGVSLELLAGRVRHSRELFLRVTDALRQRLCFDEGIWKYAMQHSDRDAMRELLSGSALSRLRSLLQPAFVGELVSFNPLALRELEPLEFDPLVNSRTYKLGSTRKMLSEELEAHYVSLLNVLAATGVGAPETMRLVYLLLLQERVPEAVRLFNTLSVGEGLQGPSPPEPVPQLESQLQYYYLAAYLDFFTGAPKHARAIAERFQHYPVPHWRERFATILAQLEEAEGSEPADVPDASGQRNQAAAASAPELSMGVEGASIVLEYANARTAWLRFYRMDVELMFSHTPFVRGSVDQFMYVRPYFMMPVELPPGQTQVRVDVPPALGSSNLLIEATANGVSCSETRFSTALRVRLVEQYGQIKVVEDATGRPLPKAYVKVFAKLSGDEVQFYKDGYTDLRGRFDYASLSSDLQHKVRRFALLVASPEHGAVVREAAPPTR